MKKTHILTTVLLSSVLLTACGTNENAETEATEVETAALEETAAQEEAAEEEKAVQLEYQVNPQTWTIDPLEDSDAETDAVLLTFDDAPYGNSLQIAETLKEKDASAIFFVNGMYLEDEEGQDALKQLHDMGFEIGNHTHTHPNLQTISEEQQLEEITATSDAVEEITGERPRFFRAPHGANTEFSNQTAEDNGMTVMNWTYGYDWMPEYQDPSALADIMVNTELLNSGGNLLMHDREWTAPAVPDIIDGIREKGFELIDPSSILSVQEEAEIEEEI